MDRVFQKVREIVAQITCADPQTITPETDLALDLGMDSLDAIMVAADVEAQFGVKIEDTQVKQIRKVRDIVSLLDHLPAMASLVPA